MLLAGLGLCLAAGHQFEVHAVAQSAPLGLVEGDVGHDGRDVGCRESLRGVGSRAAQGGEEGAEALQLDALALAEEFDDAGHCVGQDALDGALGEGAGVVGHVVGQEVEVHGLVALCDGEDLLLRFLVVGLGQSRYAAVLHDSDNLVCHSCFKD